jgi:hypothetical protein
VHHAGKVHVVLGPKGRRGPFPAVAVRGQVAVGQSHFEAILSEAVARARLSTPRLNRTARAFQAGQGASASASAQAYVNSIKGSYTQQGNQYILDTAQATSGVDFGGVDFSAFMAALASGDAAGAASAFDTSVVGYFATMVPEAGIAWAAELLIMQGIMALQTVGATSPCTIAGCEPTFGMSACDEFDSGNPFLWASIASSLVAGVPAGQPYHFSGGPDAGPSNLIDWGSFDWQPQLLPGQPLDPTKPGGPGSFEQALELAVMSLWDAQASPPYICNAIKAAGQNGDIMLNSSLRSGIWSMLGANAGALVPIFLSQWNAIHTTGAIPGSPVPCTQQSCQDAGGIWISSDGGCGSPGGTAVPCMSAAQSAPQRQIVYTVGSAQYNDPLSVAFEGLAQLSNLPSGSQLVLLVNSGPAVGPGHHIVFKDPTRATFGSSSSSSGPSLAPILSVAGGLIGALIWANPVLAMAGLGLSALFEAYE